MADILNLQRPGGRRVIGLILAEDPVLDPEPRMLAANVEAFMMRLDAAGRYARDDFPKSLLCAYALAKYLGGVESGGHAGFLDHHGSAMFSDIKPGLALAGLQDSLGPIWAGYERYIQSEGRRLEELSPDEREEHAPQTPAGITGHLMRLFPPEPDQLYFDQEAWRSPVLQDLDDRFNARSDAAFARLKAFVLQLPNLRILPHAEAEAAIAGLLC